MRTLILAAAILCSSCHAFTVEGVKLPTVVKYRCDPELKTSFLSQFAQWNDACSGIFTLVESEGDIFLDVKVTHITPPFLGLTTLYGYHTLIQIEDPSLPNVDAIMLHEIGHALGLGHTTENQNDIMSAYMLPTQPAIIQQDDIDGARTIYGLPLIVLDSFLINTTGYSRTKVFSTSGYSVEWDFGDGSAKQSGQKVKHRFVSAGIYIVTASYLGVERSLTIIIGHPKKVSAHEKDIPHSVPVVPVRLRLSEVP